MIRFLYNKIGTNRRIGLCVSANGVVLPETGESAVITVINTTIQRNTARWPWACVRAKPTEDTTAAMIQRCAVKAFHPLQQMINSN